MDNVLEFEQIVPQMRRRVLRNSDLDGTQDTYTAKREEVVSDKSFANIVCSDLQMIDQGTYEQLHAPILDLDIPHAYVPSSTPGHGHLFINVPMSSNAMQEILDVLAKHGVIEEGYARAARVVGYSSARLPGVRKGDPPPPPPPEQFPPF